MTNQEAKQVLLAYISPNGVGFPDVKEAIKIMIDREEVDAGDCISRQAVTDTTICDGIACNECSFNKTERGEFRCLFHERVNALPSVSPKGMSEVIEDIKAEISKMTVNECWGKSDFDVGLNAGLKKALSIIDKYTGGAE